MLWPVHDLFGSGNMFARKGALSRGYSRLKCSRKARQGSAVGHNIAVVFTLAAAIAMSA
jgi:hypothetical protein